MELDDVIEMVNGEIEPIEAMFGSAADRTESIAAWLILLERGIGIVKDDFVLSMNDDIDCLFDDLAAVAAIGVCCLEQYASLYEESCPWDHDFSYDEKMELEEFILEMNRDLRIAHENYAHNEDMLKRVCLVQIKNIVIGAISCMLQHGVILEDDEE